VEPLAFVEILGRHNDVVVRVPIYRWPAHAGRSYDSDVILDDPYVAARHAQIEPVVDGRFKVSDLQSVNGISLLPSAKRRDAVEVGPDDVVRLGHSQIRIRTPAYAVQPELALRPAALYRRVPAFAVTALLLVALVVWEAWVTTTTTSREEKVFFVYPAVSICMAVGVWISIWSLVGRTVGGRANYAAHGFVACAALIAIMLTDTVGDYLSFGLSAHWLEYVGSAVGALVFTYMLYRHLRLNSRAPRKKLAMFAAIASAVVFAAAFGLDWAQDYGREGRLRYDLTLKPPAFLWVSGVAPDAFLAQGERLRDKADAAARDSQ
jgi:hypothetical protein